MGGQIIDASVAPAPRQRNTEEEKAAIKQGRVPGACKPAKPVLSFAEGANLAYNFQRLAWRERRGAPA